MLWISQKNAQHIKQGPLGIDYLFENLIIWDFHWNEPFKCEEEPKIKKTNTEFSKCYEYPDVEILNISKFLKLKLKILKEIPFGEDISDIEKIINFQNKKNNKNIDFSIEESKIEKKSIEKDQKEQNYFEIKNAETLKEKKEDNFEKDFDYIEKQKNKKNIEKIKQQHNELKKDINYKLDDENNKIDINLQEYPMASKSSIEKLRLKHIEFYNLLSKVQESHAPNDFVSAYHIQDRISYILNNQTFLYKKLVSEVTILLDSIIHKISVYYNEILIKQQELKKMNKEIEKYQKFTYTMNDKVENLLEEEKFANEDVEELKKQQKL